MEYVSIRIKPSARYKLKKFMEDEKLNKIRFDKSLNYFRKLSGSYINAKTGKTTNIGKMLRDFPKIQRK